jgi:rhodanese-related sulfurtransferase
MTQPAVPTTDIDSIPDGAFILDVREDDEWAAGHIDGALHVPMGLIPQQLDALPADRSIAVVCRSGHRSARVTAYLVQSGVSAQNLAGGMQVWEAAGRPMVSETGATPTVI